MRDAWRLAVGTLTAVPVAPPRTVDRRVARHAMLLAPAATLPLGLAAGLVCWAGPRLGMPALAVGLLAVAVVVLGNRALHVDGLSDTADGLTASYDREKSLAAMRSGTSGPAGGVAVLLVLGLQAVGLGSLAAAGHAQGVVWPAVTAGLAVCVSRCALTLTCAPGVPGAREGGLGGTFVGTVPHAAAAASWIVAALVLAGSGALDPTTTWWHGPLGCVIAVVVVSALVWRTVRRLGGVTGDVFGAAIELALAALLVTLS